MKRMMIPITALMLLSVVAWSATADDIFLSPPGISSPDADNFEVYLKAHPEDESQRATAIRWYARRLECKPFALTRLKYHTLKMIEHHPANTEIYFRNASAFYLDRTYLRDVISRFEAQVKAGRKEPELLWMLALTCERAAIPPKWCDEEAKARFLRYYGLPESTAFPAEIDMPLAEKAIGYFRAAITAAGDDRFYAPFYSDQLADLLLDLGRNAEAVAVCKGALPNADETSKPGLLVVYGRSLKEVGSLDQAREAFSQVRGCDKEGFEGGPGCDTTEAETYLGLMSLDEHNPAEAAKWLLSSCRVQRCCHSTCGGFSLNLANKVLDAGEYKAVSRFCRTVLDDFTPDDEEATALLKRAQDAKKAAGKG